MRSRIPLLAVLAGLLLALPAPPVTAATFSVTDTGDDSDGVCDAAHCTLREAIAAANDAAGDDLIQLPHDATITLLLQDVIIPGVDTGDLDITDSVIISGNGATITTDFDTTTDDTRILDLDGGVHVPDVEIHDLRMTGGAVTGNGGAVRVDGGMLRLSNVTVEGNQAAGDGGGVWARGEGEVWVSAGTFAFNAAGGQGGAIGCDACRRVDVQGATFTANHAHHGGAIDVASPQLGLRIQHASFIQNWADRQDVAGSGNGGAINAEGGDLTVNDTVLIGNGHDLSSVTRTTHGGAINAVGGFQFIDNTSVSDNSAIRQGGGIRLNAGDDSRVQASTISGNSTTDATGIGGGLLTIGPTRVVNSTISGNSSATGGGAQAGLPPSLVFAPGELWLEHSTVYDNSSTGLGAASGSTVNLMSVLVGDSSGANCGGAGTFASFGHNLEDADDCNLTGVTTDQVDTDPMVGPLADNGGRPQGPFGAGFVGHTHALLAGSPAIDGGTVDPDFCPLEDQRGVERMQGDGCDIGAYEYEAEPLPAVDWEFTKTVTPTTIGVGDSAVFTLTLSNTGEQAYNVVAADHIAEELTIVDMTASAGTVQLIDRTVNWNISPLPVGATETLDITVTATAEGVYENLAVASSPDVPGGGEVTGSAELQVGEQPDEDPTSPPAEDFPPEGTSRVEGPTRIETAIEGSQAVFGDGQAGAVVLTRSDLFPDAQAGTPLAIDVDAPMLLSEPATLNPLTEAEIARVLPPGATVYLLGGTVALSQAVEDRLDTLGYDTVRYGGANRFGTAAIIAEEGLEDPETLLCADGGDFPDSVVAGAATLGAGDAAVILTSDTSMPAETAAYLAARDDAPEVIAVGGAAAVACDTATDALAGATRFETAIAVADYFFDAPQVIGVATGLDFPDALTGGAIIGRDDIGPGPMLLTTPDALPDSVVAYLTDNAADITSVVIFGGTAAVGQAVEARLGAILGAK